MSTERLNQVLGYAVKQGVSDVHLKVGRPPLFRKDGRLLTNKNLPPLPARFFEKILDDILNPAQHEKLEEIKDLDFAYAVEEIGRFRGNVFYQMGELAMVLRHIPSTIRTAEELQLPEVLGELAMEGRGLILVTGATGSGKSTTLAAMIDKINRNRRVHIITIEDPIEFVHTDAKALISQRQVGEDARSFAGALRAALRQDPDVILVGEMRDRETIETALHAAETGHLVMSTLHTLDAKETIARVVNMFPSEEQLPVRHALASTLRAVVSQRLVRTRDGKGRAAACEIMIGTARVADLITDPDRTAEITMAIEEGHSAYRSQSFDQALLQLYRAKRISLEEALDNATNAADFKLKVSGISGLT